MNTLDFIAEIVVDVRVEVTKVELRREVRKLGAGREILEVVSSHW
jgi:hypothetical protein